AMSLESPGQMVKVVVFSQTLPASDYPGIDIVANGAEETVRTLRVKQGKDVWLFGGGLLFRSLSAAGLVDTVEVAIMPVLLGHGIPFLPSPAEQTALRLTEHKLVSLKYAVLQTSAPIADKHS